ncbi:MAG: flagellar hook-associated protein 3 FlgL [Roseibaca calidilacus]|uniref:Flagellar hook-associated protein 3 FlgL n=1 Tax=Roseibaca calidilacus TaxID=1666912 RepID=A0A0P7W9C7_9RHOB|nr:hypothetical protein [Roseibaca calidilacus]KPP90751.1 MAG: flagellar hook-associated protein 3 FlgL [Roseibaca calidilacus]CUX83499.1 flagellar hook-associated protein 3 FlgL [Roseibaca calidilacus]
MIPYGTGDLSQTLMLRRIGGGLRQEIARVSAEIASGQRSDPARALGGNLMQLATIEHGLVQADRYASSAKFGATLLASQQNSVEQIGIITERLAPDLRMSAQPTSPDALGAAAARARAGFEDAIGLLNTKVAGRYIFAGIDGDQRPFAGAQDMLDSITAGLPANATPADVTAHVTAWFADGGPFEALAYQGGPAPSNSIDLGDGNSFRLDTTGASPGIRDTLAAMALGAMAETLSAQMPLADRRALLAAGSEAMTASTDGRIAAQANIGAQEARAAKALAQAEAKSASYKILRTELRAADPYENAMALESAAQKLDALYLVTARLSRLSLTEYLR